jgi:hypothetical protein
VLFAVSLGRLRRIGFPDSIDEIDRTSGGIRPPHQASHDRHQVNNGDEQYAPSHATEKRKHADDEAVDRVFDDGKNGTR